MNLILIKSNVNTSILKNKKPDTKVSGFFSSGNWTRTSDLRVMSYFINNNLPVYKGSKWVFLAKILKNVCVFVCAIWLIILLKI